MNQLCYTSNIKNKNISFIEQSNSVYNVFTKLFLSKYTRLFFYKKSVLSNAENYKYLGLVLNSKNNKPGVYNKYSLKYIIVSGNDKNRFKINLIKNYGFSRLS